MRDIKVLLERWGAWAASGERKAGYAAVASGFRGLVTHHHSRRVQCNDEDGVIIDGCISRLAAVCKERHDILVAHYLYQISLRSIARRRRCADGTIRRKMQTAEVFICGLLTAREP